MPSPGVGVLLRVLVVEDDRACSLFLRIAFRDDRLAVDHAENGLEALELAAVNRYDLVVTDVRMPEMDGPALIRELRARESGGRRVPIIVQTAHHQPEDAEHMRAVGADALLIKPFSLEEVRQLGGDFLGLSLS